MILEDFLKPAILSGVISFIVLLIFTFVVIARFKPSLIKTAAIQMDKEDRPTTLNWSTILVVFLGTSGAGAGVSVLANVVIFLMWNEWTFEPWSILGLVGAFAYVIFREYDAFITGLLRKK